MRATTLLIAVLLLSGAVPSQQKRPAWPRQLGAYIATSSETIPLFPRVWSGFRFEDGKDFGNKPFSNRGSVRIFQGKDWQGIPKFPNTMNGCSAGAFMIRWVGFWIAGKPIVRLNRYAYRHR